MIWIARLLFFKISSWKLEGTIEPSVKKCIIIVAPHTSWYDFYIGVLVRKILDFHIDFVAKAELFIPPFGWYFRWVGGTALDRTANQNKVESIAQFFKTREVFRLALSPEGTRKKTERWRTGFYYIAKIAQVPIIMVAFDYRTKTVKFSEPFCTTENLEKDFSEIQNFYKDIEGKIPEKF
jgi:1-acyl-sn-glycerol-3-phosphate acyltransferase